MFLFGELLADEGDTLSKKRMIGSLRFRTFFGPFSFPTFNEVATVASADEPPFFFGIFSFVLDDRIVAFASPLNNDGGKEKLGVAVA